MYYCLITDQLLYSSRLTWQMEGVIYIHLVYFRILAAQILKSRFVGAYHVENTKGNEYFRVYIKIHGIIQIMYEKF